MNKKIILVISAVILVFGAFIFILLKSTPENKWKEYKKGRTVEIFFEVTGSAKSARIAVSNKSGRVDHYNLPIPWTSKMTFIEGSPDSSISEGQRLYLYLSAQNEGRDGCVHARIYFNGRVLKSSMSCDEFGIASIEDSVVF